MNVVFFGTSGFGLPSLEAIARTHSLKAVVSTPNKPQGRSLKPQASPIKEWALDKGVPYFDFFKEHSAQTLRTLKDMGPDAFVVASFGVILDKETLGIPRLMPLNIHASLLPKYRGASPMQAALLNGDTHTGITVIRMVERLDAGDMLLKKRLAIAPGETIGELEKRLAALGAESILEALELLAKGKPPLTAQDEKEASLTKKIAKERGRIVWNDSAERIDARVRAYQGWPGSFFFCRGKRIVVCKAHSLPHSPAVPGTVLEASEKEGILVAAAGSGAVRLETLQLEGKKALGWREFLRGFRLKKGEVLE